MKFVDAGGAYIEPGKNFWSPVSGNGMTAHPIESIDVLSFWDVYDSVLKNDTDCVLAFEV